MGSVSGHGGAVKMTVALLVVFGFSHLGVAWEDSPATGVVHVAGKVLCQDCTQGWNDWVNGDKAIKGCKVAITCMDERRKIVYYGSDETDERGQYEMAVSKYINGKELKPNLCSVRLVSSPDETCNVATDFAGGLSGVKLSRPQSVYRDMTKFVVEPFYYTTPMCDQPDTDGDDEDQGGKY